MHEYDPEIILLVTGIIVKPSTRKMYVDKTHENTQSELLGDLQTLF